MNMYIEVLSGALQRWDADLADDELLDYVLICRRALPARDLGAGVWSEDGLAVEVAYDRALIHLAARYGVDVAPRNFAHPRIERARLEFELARRGVDLEEPPRRRRRRASTDGTDPSEES